MTEHPDRISRLENAVVDLATVLSEGHPERLDAHIGAKVVEAGQRLQAFLEDVVSERRQ
jgi:hypothetical protein